MVKWCLSFMDSKMLQTLKVLIAMSHELGLKFQTLGSTSAESATILVSLYPCPCESGYF